MSTQPQTTVPTEELRALIADALELPVEEVTDDAHFQEDLEVDSLISLEIGIRISDRYGIKIEDDDLIGLSSFREVNELVQAGLAARPAG